MVGGLLPSRSRTEVTVAGPRGGPWGPVLNTVFLSVTGWGLLPGAVLPHAGRGVVGLGRLTGRRCCARSCRGAGRASERLQSGWELTPLEPRGTAAPVSQDAKEAR